MISFDVSRNVDFVISTVDSAEHTRREGLDKSSKAEHAANLGLGYMSRGGRTAFLVGEGVNELVKVDRQIFYGLQTLVDGVEALLVRRGLRVLRQKISSRKLPML